MEQSIDFELHSKCLQNAFSVNQSKILLFGKEWVNPDFVLFLRNREWWILELLWRFAFVFTILWVYAYIFSMTRHYVLYMKYILYI